MTFTATTGPLSAGQQPGGYGQQQRVAVIAGALATGATVPAIAAAVLPFLYGTGITLQALTAALTLGAAAPTVTEGTAGPTVTVVTGAEPSYRAAYVLAAAQRITTAALSTPGTGPDSPSPLDRFRTALTVERRYLQLHRHAQANRLASAVAVDRAAGGDPTVPLRWKATMDSRTSTECAAANGGLFYADNPPAIGYPGSVHPHCRCKAVPSGTNVGRSVNTLVAGSAH